MITLQKSTNLTSSKYYVNINSSPLTKFNKPDQVIGDLLLPASRPKIQEIYSPNNIKNTISIE